MECAIATDWIIDEKELREINDEENGIESEWNQTAIQDVKYCIRIEQIEEEPGKRNVLIFLCFDTRENITANYNFSIFSANYYEKFSQIFPNSDYERCKVFSRELFFDPKNGFFQNGKLTLHLRGTLTFEKIYEIKRGKTAGQIFWKNQDKNFIIEVDGKEIKAHKIILRERSPYFAAMFDSGMKEARENKVKFEGFPFEIIEAAIKICYDAEIENIFTVEDYLLLLEFSHLYDIEHVKTHAEYNLAAFIALSNVCRIANASIKFNAEKLRLCCKNNLIAYSKIVKCFSYDDTITVADFDLLDVDFKAELRSEIHYFRFV